ncbi:hypothetical protein RCL1_003834 [Eukaryota sp. TZLM3-RCL]
MLLPFCSELEAANVTVLSQRDHPEHVFDSVVEQLSAGILNQHRYIAVDTEWFAFAKGLQLDVIQLSTHSHTLIIQLHGQTVLYPSLLGLLMDETILKLFKDPKEDLLRFKQCLRVNVSPCFDISDMCTLLSFYNYNSTMSDDSFARVFFNLGLTSLIPKNKKVSKSNWSREFLAPNQITYAAFDTIFINTVYSLMTHTHPSFSQSLFDSWCIPQNNSINIWNSVSVMQKAFTSLFIWVYAFNPATSTVTGPSTIANFDVLQFFGICSQCKSSLKIDSNISTHKCFDGRGELRMCCDCRLVAKMIPSLIPLHKFFQCLGNYSTNSDLLNLVTISSNEGAGVSVLLFNLKTVYSLFIGLDPSIQTCFESVERGKLTFTNILDCINSFNEEKRLGLLSFIHESTPALFNSEKIKSKNFLGNMPLSNNLNNETIRQAEKILVFLILTQDSLLSLPPSSAYQFGPFHKPFKTIFRSILDSVTVNWDGVLSQLQREISSIADRCNRRDANQAKKKTNSVQEDSENRVQNSQKTSQITPQITTLSADVISRLSSNNIFRICIGGDKKFSFCKIVVSTKKPIPYGGHNDAVLASPLSFAEVSLLLSNVNHSITPFETLNVHLKLLSNRNSRMNALPGDVVIVELAPHNSCNVKQVIVPGDRTFQCRVVSTKNGIQYNPLAKGVPAIKVPSSTISPRRGVLNVRLTDWRQGSSVADGTLL